VGEEALMQIPAGVRPLCLDLGCGPGAISLVLAELGFAVVGVDSSPAMIAEARAAASASKENDLSFRNQSLETFLDEFEGIADLVVCSSVLEYLADPVALLGAMSLRLRDGGVLAISLPNHRSIIRRALGIARAAHLPWGSYMTLWANRISQEELVHGARRYRLSPIRLRHFGFPSAAPILERASGNELVGTLTLFVFRKCGSVATRTVT
jgi:2-polyprenyl-3-methyl-5-hydroxy-6-metoxy-1,4-benzoquinol methylase